MISPTHLDSAKLDAAKAALESVRTAIANYHAFSATPSGEESAPYPTAADLQTAGNVMARELPVNPFSTGQTKNAVVPGTVKGAPSSPDTLGAWCYNASTGEFWAGTESGAGEAAL